MYNYLGGVTASHGAITILCCIDAVELIVRLTKQRNENLNTSLDTKVRSGSFAVYLGLGGRVINF